MIVNQRVRQYSIVLIAACMLVGVGGIAMAHHSFAMFDTTSSVTLTGTVTEFQWTNPHAYIELDVPDSNSTGKQHWTIELGSPSILQQSGWKYKDLKFGDKVTATINPLRSKEPGGLLVQVKLPDGRTLGNGPGRGPAAPAATPAK